MPDSCTRLFVHAVWATWDRLPLVSAASESRLYASIAEKCRSLKCTPVAIGGDVDHVHLLVRLHPVISVATLVKETKGASSHLMTHEVRAGEFFRWQGAYGAFTLREDDVPTVERYVRGQKEHHAAGDLRREWEETTFP